MMFKRVGISQILTGGAMDPNSVGVPDVSGRLQQVTVELRRIQDLLISESEVDGRILTDFRDAVNRIRNTAWAIQQYAESKTTEKDPQTVLSVLAGERVRVAYQLCKLVQEDLNNTEIQFQKGHLLRLHAAAKELELQLQVVVGN
jgi:hypothetical protein